MRRPMWVATTRAAPPLEAVSDFPPLAAIHDRQLERFCTLPIGDDIYLQREPRLLMKFIGAAPHCSQAQKFYNRAESHRFDPTCLSTTLLRDAASDSVRYVIAGTGDACA